VIDVDETKDAIVAASNYPLSIIMVGVGDGTLHLPLAYLIDCSRAPHWTQIKQLGSCAWPGPFGLMEEFDDHLPRRSFDNVRGTRASRPIHDLESNDTLWLECLHHHHHSSNSWITTRSSTRHRANHLT